jgi:FKBP-type peptidyl-prolyl cis-trans isomerase 2
MAAEAGNKVKVHYTGTFDDGEVFDSSREAQPLEFEIGAGQVIPGFDQAIQGMEVGESKQVRIPEADAYGEYNPEMVFTTDHSQFEEGVSPEIGQQFQAQTPDGQPMLLVVKDVSEEGIVMDANHPMAGKDLNFDLELVEII